MNLKERIDKIKISIGIEKKSLQNNLKKLKEYNIKNIKDAKLLLNNITEEIDDLINKEEKLENKIDKLLSKIEE